MKAKLLYFFLGCGLTTLFLVGTVHPVIAQQTDTSQTTKERELKQRQAPQPYHSERSADRFLLEESGTYGVPEPKEYYRAPFTAQESLDRAVAAYHEELENSVANTPLFQFIGKIAPFITNQFEFGVYQIYDLPIVERGHPALYPQTDTEKKEQK